MASWLRVLLFVSAIVLLCLGGALGQGPTNLTVVSAQSTASISKSGADTLNLRFIPSNLQLSGVIFINATDCGGGGLPADVNITGTNITTRPDIVNVSARALGSDVGTVQLFNLSLNISSLSFPVNPSNGSYTVLVSSGTAHVDRLNGSLTGNSFDQSPVDFTFSNQSEVVNGTFRNTTNGLEMTASSTISIPLSELVSAAGFGSNALIKTVTSGGTIDIPVNLVATGPNPCSNSTAGPMPSRLSGK